MKPATAHAGAVCLLRCGARAGAVGPLPLATPTNPRGGRVGPSAILQPLPRGDSDVAR